MTREEVIKIMSVLRGAYPQFYRNISKTEALDTIALWCDMFQDDEASLVAAAVKSVIEADEKGFPPSIGQVKAKMRLFTQKEGLTEAEAWGIVSKAVRNGFYGAKEEFEKMPPVIQRIVGSPSQLKEWAMMDSETLHSVVASNFQRSYKAIAARENEIAKLPADVKGLVQKIGGPSMDCLGAASTGSLPAPRYESEEETRSRFEAERRKGWEAASLAAQKDRKRNQDIIAALRGGREIGG